MNLDSWMRLIGNYEVYVVLREGQAGTQSVLICVLLCRLAIVSNKRFGSFEPRRFFYLAGSFRGKECPARQWQC